MECISSFDKDNSNMSYIPGILLSAFDIQTDAMFTSRSYDYAPSTGKETEARKGFVTCSRQHS